jgi:hypothetical protein
MPVTPLFVPIIPLFIPMIPFFFGENCFLASTLNYKRRKSDHLAGFLAYLAEKTG